MLLQVEAAPGPGELGPGALWPTLLVLVLLVAALLLVRLRGLGARARAASGQLEVQAQLALSPGHTLYLVRAGERRLLLGGAASGLTLLTELDARPPAARAATAEPTDLAPAAAKATTPSADPTADWLAAARGPRPLVDGDYAAGGPGEKGLR
ncbi:MAG: flagellar biosynthetic protein FliO [Polyangia bacterium]